MDYKIAWVGLADKNYWDYIAKYCVPSWSVLPGDKFLVTDEVSLSSDHFLNLIYFDQIKNQNAVFTKHKISKKTTNFWKKMQAQRWAISTLTDYDWVILCDTDIEVINFNLNLFLDNLQDIKNQNKLWGIGFKRDMFEDSIDSGFISVNMKHPEVNKAFVEYENIWESGKIFNLKKSYDGNAMWEMVTNYPAFKFLETGLGDGKFLYDIGLFHWGGRLPKEIRRNLKDVFLYLEEIQSC